MATQEQDLERNRYEEKVARRFDQWQERIEHLRTQADSGAEVHGAVSDERTQDDKLEGQLGMLREHFLQLRSLDTMAAWHEIKQGVEKKVSRLDKAVQRTEQRLNS